MCIIFYLILINNYAGLLCMLGVFTPTFVEILSTNVEENIKKLKNAGVTFPFSKFACKFILKKNTKVSNTFFYFSL